MGDSNIDTLGKGLPVDHINFINAMLSNDLTNVIVSFTRVTPFFRKTIDHIRTSLIDPVVASSIECSLTDHYPVCAIFSVHLAWVDNSINYRTFAECNIPYWRGISSV